MLLNFLVKKQLFLHQMRDVMTYNENAVDNFVKDVFVPGTRGNKWREREREGGREGERE